MPLRRGGRRNEPSQRRRATEQRGNNKSRTRHTKHTRSRTTTWLALEPQGIGGHHELKTCADRPATVRALAFSCPPRFLSRPIGTPPHAAGLRDDRNFCPALPPRHRGTTTPTRHPRLNVRRTWSVAQPVFGDRKLVGDFHASHTQPTTKPEPPAGPPHAGGLTRTKNSSVPTFSARESRNCP